MKAIVPILALGLSLTACSLFDDEPGRQLGILALSEADGSEARGGNDWPNGIPTDSTGMPIWHELPWGGPYEPGRPLELPEVVQAGVPFIAVVRTHDRGHTCMWKDSEEITVSEGLVEIAVYDRDNRTDPAQESCPDTMSTLVRHLELTLDTPGEVEVVLRGRRVLSNSRDETMHVRRMVVVE